MLLLSFLPLYFAILSANLAPRHNVWRGITIVTLVLLSSFIALVGLIVSAISLSPAVLPPEITIPDNALLLGGLVILTAVLGLFLLVPAVRQQVIAGLRLKMDADKMAHAVGLVLAVWLVGLTLVQLLLVQSLSLETITQGQSLSLATVWEQGMAFVLFAILGVGIGFRRTVRESMSRLGLEMPTRRQLALVVGTIVALLLWDFALSLVWEAFAPGSYDRISSISESLLGGIMTPIGALSIGLSAGIGEELLFRGAIQPRFGLLLATILFTIGHGQYEFSPALLSVFVIGFVLGLIRQRENTTTAILIHAGYNTLVVLLAIAGE